MKTDYSEYNKIYYHRASNIVCFIKNLKHAMQKVEIPGAFEKIMHQLECIGYSDELVSTICEASSCYKEHHKKRIFEEQNPVDHAISGDILYTVVWAQKLHSDAKEKVCVYSVAKNAEKAKADMKECISNVRASFKETVKNAADPTAMLCFEASASEDRYEIHLEGSENDIYCRLWVGKATFL